jgi:Flp pilus assembly pilin Flp
MISLEYAVLAAFIAGSVMVIIGAIGNLAMQIFDKVWTLL